MSITLPLSLGRKIPTTDVEYIISTMQPKDHYRKASNPSNTLGIGDNAEIISMLLRLVAPVTRIEFRNNTLFRKEVWAVEVSSPIVEAKLEDTPQGIYVDFQHKANTKNNKFIPVRELSSLVKFVTPASSEYHCDFVVINENMDIKKESLKTGRGADAFAVANGNKTNALADSKGFICPDLAQKIWEDMSIRVNTVTEMITHPVFMHNRLHGWSYINGFEKDPSKLADSLSLSTFTKDGKFYAVSFDLTNAPALEEFSRILKINRPASSRRGYLKVKDQLFYSFNIRRSTLTIWDDMMNNFLSLPVM